MDIAFVEVSLCLCKASAIFIMRRLDWYCHYHKNRENLARTFLPLPLMTSFYKVAGKEYHLNIYIYIYIFQNKECYQRQLLNNRRTIITL